jgi:hypothetical protein
LAHCNASKLLSKKWQVKLGDIKSCKVAFAQQLQKPGGNHLECWLIFNFLVGNSVNSDSSFRDWAFGVELCVKLGLTTIWHYLKYADFNDSV